MRNFIIIGAALLTVTSATTAQIVTKSTPTSVQVQAGGSAVALLLDGLQLTAVTGARLLLSGQPVSVVKGTLRGQAQLLAGGASRLTVDLTADQVAQTGLYQLELVAGTQRIMAPVSVSVIRLPQPIDPNSGQLGQPVAVGVAVPPSINGVTCNGTPCGTTPNLVKLEPGSTVSVMLQGTNLGALEWVRLVSNGAVVSNATAQLQAVADPTHREVVLKAPTASMPPWNVPLELQVGARVGGTINVPVQVQVVRPDLTITNISADPPTADYVDIRYGYKNQGGADARYGPNQRLSQLASDPASNPYPHTPLYVNDPSSHTIVPGGGGGGTMRVYLDALPGPGTYTFTLYLDLANTIAESNESNNKATITLQLNAPPRPDLIIERAATTGSAGRPTGFNVWVRNQGQGNADPINYARVISSCQEVAPVAVTGPIIGNQSVQKTLELYSPAYFFPIGSHTCKFTLQWNVEYSGGMVARGQELNSTNNEFSYTFNVPAPDLAIKSITTNPAQPTQTPTQLRTYKFGIEVVNLGPGIHLGAPSNAVGRTPVQFLVTSGCTPPMPVAVDLYPGATTMIELPAMPNVLLPASYSCEFRIQPQGPDGNAANNAKSYSWAVRLGS